MACKMLATTRELPQESPLVAYVSKVRKETAHTPTKEGFCIELLLAANASR